MNHATMGQMEVETSKFPEEKKQIYVVQGNLDDTRVRQLPKINGYILVTGNVFFVKNNTVPGGLIVLGDAEMVDATVKGNMTVYGKCNARRLIIHGELTTKVGATSIGDFTAMRHVYI